MARINQDKVDKLVESINNSDKEIFWEEGQPKFRSKEKKKSGRTARARGARFELKVRRDLEGKGFSVDKWTNNIDLPLGKMIPAKRKFNPYSKVMTIGTGFPDFIAISHVHDELYSVIGVEVKVNGTLSKEEKEKCIWYLNKKIFSKIWIAHTKKDGRNAEITYVDFKERYIDKTNKT